MNPKVVVVGSINLDLTFSVPRLPVSGETLIATALRTGGGGKGGNQAVAAARLGADVTFIGQVGHDLQGADLRRELDGERVATRHLIASDSAPSGMAAVFIDGNSGNAIVVAPGANACLSADHVGTAVTEEALPGTVVLASLEVPDDAVIAAAEAAAMVGAIFVLNPAPARQLPADLLHHVTYLTPNQVEAEALPPPQDLLDEFPIEGVVVTLGAEGVLLYSRTGVQRRKAFDVVAVDPTGAGDAFNAAFACALATGQSLDDALDEGMAAGALATRAVGARSTLPRQEDVQEMIRMGIK